MLTFKLILLLNENWKNYQENCKFEVRDAEKREVTKMLECMNPEKCYSVYMCEECVEIKVIPHSCKSRICSQCGKKHADELAEKINKEMYAVPYRHVILTISDRLWSYFEWNAQMQKLMMNTAAKTMKYIVRNYNRKGKG